MRGPLPARVMLCHPDDKDWLTRQVEIAGGFAVVVATNHNGVPFPPMDYDG